MKEQFDLQQYMTDGVERIVKEALKATLSNPAESLFMAKYAKSSKESSKKRFDAEKNGEHIPPFLIASITSECNLHCAGCYARSNDTCVDDVPMCQLSASDWKRIFEESRDLGIGFILLAGGEPMMRRDVIQEAGRIPEILFPIFTNGTVMDEEYLSLFKKSRNLIPVFSIEGRQEKTDERRGAGVYQQLLDSMKKMQDNSIKFGASVTVTTSNLEEVTSDEFLDKLESFGCKLVVYVEFVPVTEESTELAPGDAEREYMATALSRIRNERQEMVFVSFPGDEKTSGGCLAAGRGFFHINSHGGAEPCPFSPYSDINVKDTSVKEALHSKLFTSLADGNIMMEEHIGGCVLFEKKDQVQALLRVQ